jgi:hypothetical protein
MRGCIIKPKEESLITVRQTAEPFWQGNQTNNIIQEQHAEMVKN